MAGRASLERRFADHLRELGLLERRVRLLVAVSGGLDSMVLLYLLRHGGPALPLELIVAHLDHAMRPDSGSDARWLSGFCAAWGLPLVSSRLATPPAGETEARTRRYEFLRRVARERGADHIVTAHHADDQAETVLFRVLRGTGLTGLAGMAAHSAAGVVRPLLPFWRRELEAFAAGHRLRWREDPSNRDLDPARNRIRHTLLPLAEAAVAPAARVNLVRLASLAREADAALEREADRVLRGVSRRDGDSIVLARAELAGYDSAIASRVLRKVLRRFGIVLGGTGTRRALQFIIGAPSGRALDLPRDVRVILEFDAARIARHSPPTADEPLVIDSPVQGAEWRGRVRLGGRSYGVLAAIRPWTPELAEDLEGYWTAVALERVRFPCWVRGRRPGDRLRTAGGSKRLKKLFLERRIPRSERRAVPVLADSTGRVLWVGGIGSAPEAAPQPGEAALFLSIVND